MGSTVALLENHGTFLMLSKAPRGYVDVRTKGGAPGFGGHGEIVAGTHQANHQKDPANSRLDAPALRMLTCSAQACRTPTSLPPRHLRKVLSLHRSIWCCHCGTVIPCGRMAPLLWGKSQRSAGGHLTRCGGREGALGPLVSLL